MKIVLDFLPIMARGGGLQNARNLWRVVGEHGGAHQWVAWASQGLGLPAPGPGGHVELRTVSLDGTLQRIRAQNGPLLRHARAWGADVVFTPIGVPPLAAGPPRVFGWHDSTIAYPESPTHDLLGPVERVNEQLRALAARLAGQRAQRICVQTEAMATRLSRRWGVPRHRFHLVPNGPSEYLRSEPPQPEQPPDGAPVVLVVAEPKNAKNLEIVPHVARNLHARGLDARVVVTCDPPADGSPVGRAILSAGHPPLEFVGRIPHHRLGDVYRAASVVLLPSWLESFSATYVEALHFGVPLVTSDMDFARAICGDAALYADPSSAHALAEMVALVLDSPGVRASLRAKGFARVATFPDWRRRLDLYLEALQAAALERT